MSYASVWEFAKRVNEEDRRWLEWGRPGVPLMHRELDGGADPIFSSYPEGHSARSATNRRKESGAS